MRTMEGPGSDNPFCMSTGFLRVKDALVRTSAARRGKGQKRKRYIIQIIFNSYKISDFFISPAST